MALTKDQILHEAMTLRPEERDEIAEALWQEQAPGELHANQLEELRRRIRDLDDGLAQTIPGEQVMQEARARIAR